MAAAQSSSSARTFLAQQTSADLTTGQRPSLRVKAQQLTQLTSKIHLLADSGCRPLAQVTSSGQRHDSLAFMPLMGQLRIARRGHGRPRTRPGQVPGDKACYATAIRAHLRRRKIKATIPQPSDQVRNRVRRGSADGRPPAFDPCRLQAAQHRGAGLRQTAPALPRPSRRARCQNQRTSGECRRLARPVAGTGS
jgi:hypothetical protein